VIKKASRLIDYAIWAGLLAAVVFVVVRRHSGPETGTPAAAFDLPLVGSEARFNLAAQRGKPVLVEVFASWCGACRRAAPTLADAFADHRANVQFVGVVVDDDPREAARVKSDWGIPYDVAMDDGSVSRNYNVQLLPTIILIDKTGTVRRVTTGMPTRSQLEGWIAEL
jgi:cytochrome c biogenesis protein CcmG/thiol:disulfide interchange protein DsbE